jgi:SPP1 gp7 family putative phage head morphogenesis protein
MTDRNNYPFAIEKQQELVYIGSILHLSKALQKKIKAVGNLSPDAFKKIENELFDELGKAFLSYEILATEFEKIGSLLDAWVYAEVKRYIQKAMLRNRNKFMSIEFNREDPLVQDFMQSYTKSNVQLVQSLGKTYIPQVTELASQTFLQGGDKKTLIYNLLQFTNGEKEKARFWADDQLGDSYADFTKMRQISVGITEYIWHTVKDNHVREAHRELEGQRFDWKRGALNTGLLTKPGARHPGQDYNCRCTAEAILE